MLSRFRKDLHQSSKIRYQPSQMANLLRLGIKKIKIFCSTLDFPYLCSQNADL